MDTGFGPPIDPLALDDSYFHGPGQLITVFRPHEAPGPVLQVNRLQIKGATIIDRPSLPPGYPQGTKTVAKEVNQEIALVSSGGQAFMTTPPSCPRSGKVDLTTDDHLRRRDRGNRNQRYAMREVKPLRRVWAASVSTGQRRPGSRQPRAWRWSR